MRRSLVPDGVHHLKYEIREIVAAARRFGQAGLEICWENIGDPIQKGESFPGWMKEIVAQAVQEDSSYAYSDSQGHRTAREFLASQVNARGGCRITGEHILFFNGLGDAVAKVFNFLKREARVIGPSPAYSTLSSAEAAHSGYEHLTYRLDPERGWLPDLEDLENKVRYNDSVAGILLINPDNPTGVVYDRALLEKIVDIARRHRLFVLCDETYGNIVFNGAEPCFLSEVIAEVPGISLRSISKEYPWPGARCGWIEVYNKDSSPDFSAYIDSLAAAKRLEVCSTSLPQLTIPRIMGDPRYPGHLASRASMFGQRAQEAYQALSGIPGTQVSLPQGALYFTLRFAEGVLNRNQKLRVENPQARTLVESLVQDVEPDKRFVYYLLASSGICVVPLTGFCCSHHGFRMTLLETDGDRRAQILRVVKEKISEYLSY